MRQDASGVAGLAQGLRETATAPGTLRLVAAAAGVQTFSFGTVLARGGPERSTETLASLPYDCALRRAEPGAGAAVVTVTGAVLGVLGIVPTVVAVTPAAAVAAQLLCPDRLALTANGSRARTPAA
ncbi:hypothetical protein [Nonomuraea sp. B1E8]|uniref:hypothetical protein n=1 Tax=unclassified Nonomuraea TaxID=2593643 RepID=UPI00325D3C7F